MRKLMSILSGSAAIAALITMLFALAGLETATLIAAGAALVLIVAGLLTTVTGIVFRI